MTLLLAPEPVAPQPRTDRAWRFHVEVRFEVLPDGRLRAIAVYRDEMTGAEGGDRLHFAEHSGENRDLAERLLGVGAHFWAHEQAHGHPAREGCPACRRGDSWPPVWTDG